MPVKNLADTGAAQVYEPTRRPAAPTVVSRSITVKSVANLSKVQSNDRSPKPPGDCPITPSLGIIFIHLLNAIVNYEFAREV